MNGLIAIPVYNEERNLNDLVSNLKNNFPIEKLLFIDDGSSDNSLEILKEHKVNYLLHSINLGYEETLKTAMNFLLKTDMDFIVFFDADGQHRIEDLINMISIYESGKFDFIIGSRYQNQDHQKFSLRILGTNFFSILATVFSGMKITDATCGLKLITKEYIPLILKLPTEDLHAELIAGLSMNGARINEMSIKVNARDSGDSMYHFWKSFFYPAKTFLCLIAGLIYHNKLKK